jgi:prepilin-type N-terminal cleavage/methylation domain-containing protein
MPTRRRSGFTLIELLIVVVIVGVLASMALPKFANTRGKAYLSAVRSDLKQIAVAQEGYMYTAGVYTANPVQLSLSLSPGVRVLDLNVSATGNGWSATLTHDASAPQQCTLFVGAGATHPAYATSEGRVTCN